MAGSRALLIAIGAMVAQCAYPAKATADDSCDAASAYVEKLLANPGRLPDVFSAEPVGLEPGSDLFHGRWIDANSTSGAQGQRPSRSLLTRLHYQRPTSAIANCPSLRSFLQDHHISHGEEAVRAAMRSEIPGEISMSFRAVIVGVSAPVLSYDGTEALLLTSEASGETAASGAVRYLRRNRNGRWIVVSWLGLWIS